MAGEKLDERFGEGFTDRVKPDGMQDPTKSGRYSKKELLAEFRARPDGVKIDEGEGNLVDKYQGLVDSGTTFNRQAQDYLEGHGVVFNRPEEIEMEDMPEDVMDEPIQSFQPVSPREMPTFSSAPIQTITTSPSIDEDDFASGLSDGGYNFDQTMNVNQDNDINNMTYGSNNNISNYQDNSIGNYMNIGDGLYAKKDPMVFKTDFMTNLFN